MDIEKLDIELNKKIIETYKILLKNKLVKILFEAVSGDILESTAVSFATTNFKLFKKSIPTEINDLNKKYTKLVRKKHIDKTRSMTEDDAISYIKRKTWYLFPLRPFLGKKFIKETIDTVVYRINYNGILIAIEKNDYDKLNYYAKYVYKLQQLYKLNDILGLNNTYDIIFGDDEEANDMFNDLYKDLGDILNPKPNNGKGLE